ncbi:hypothetical protein [Desulfosporosinus sp.]|uniref:hypothetical protein n=1 Tax=Desulfosporosinus sp. TaxID=157907 RepID=UPI0025B7DFA4|nr:hypothetical protein [Desulfosporosinus sp.]MBC2723515.1 hypothetical protein [Desulfosporosinus sp.]MBC2728648.1 hypothetical protein [Desulfosporosinus sp.]
MDKSDIVSPSRKVLKFINDCFVPGSVTVKECPLVPGGKIIRDKSGSELLIFWSVEYECLMQADLGKW